MLEKLLSDKLVQKFYVKAAMAVDDALSYEGVGKPEGYDNMVARWAKWEAEYTRRGYRAISIPDVSAFVEEEKPLPLGRKRGKDEDLVLYATPNGNVLK